MFTPGLIIRILCIWGLILASNAEAVTSILGGSVDASVPVVPPCTTFGFVEEQQLTLPTGFNGGIMLRVMPNVANNVGYAITQDAASQRLVVFDLTTMTLRASSIIATFPGQYVSGKAVLGDIDSTDSRLYIFREARQGVGACPAGIPIGNCISFARFNESATKEAEGFTGTDETNNIDDARDAGLGTYLIIHAEAAPTSGNRRLANFSKTSMTKLGNGTEFGLSGRGHLSRLFNGNLYGMLDLTTPNGLRVPQGTNTSNGSFSMTGSFGSDVIGAIYGATFVSGVGTINGESDTSAGAQAERAYVTESSLSNSNTSFYAASGADQAALFQGTFFDALNAKIFSVRSGNVLLRTTRGVSDFVVEQNFSCVNCNYNPAISQEFDYAPQKARLFTISNSSPAVINRIRVCATGGPPA